MDFASSVYWFTIRCVEIWARGFFRWWHAVGLYMTQYHGKRHQISEQHRSSLEALIPQFEGRNLLSCVCVISHVVCARTQYDIWLSTSRHVTLADKLSLSYAILICI